MSLFAHGIVSGTPMKAALKGLAHELAEYHNKDTGLCCPSVERLAKNLCCTVRNIQLGLKQLEEEGIVVRQERFEGGRQVTSNYVFLTKNPSPRPEANFTGEGEASFTPGGEASFTQNRKKESEEVIRDPSPKKPSAEKPAKGFVRPTLADVQAYARERGLKVNAKDFFLYYEAGDWRDSQGKPVKSWRQRMLTWDMKAREKTGPKEQKTGSKEAIL